MAKRKRSMEDNRGGLQKLFDRLALSWRLMIDQRVSLFHKVIPPLALLYLISPIDFIPDILLPFGIMDDIGVVILALEFFIRMSPSEVVQEHLAALRGRMNYDAGYTTDEDFFEGDFTVKDR